MVHRLKSTYHVETAVTERVGISWEISQVYDLNSGPIDKFALPALIHNVAKNLCRIMSSWIDSQFLRDAGTIINAFYGEKIFLDNQDKLNFWIAQDMGTVGGYMPITQKCNNTPPANWATAYTFADDGAIVHRSGIRDCSAGGTSSGNVTRADLGIIARIFVHESGHAAFGLADEYCCDGGYWQDPFLRNLFSNLSDCNTNSVGTGNACGSFVDNRGNTRYTSDPDANHLMGADNGHSRPLDQR